jgi:hypothetical protein
MTAPKRRLNDPPPLRVVRNDPSKPEPKIPQKKPPKREGNRWNDLNQFIDISLRDLNRRQLAVWLILFRDARKGIATTSQTDIARRSGLQRPTVSTTIGELEQLGLIQTIHQGGLNRGMSRYRVLSIIQQG